MTPERRAPPQSDRRKGASENNVAFELHRLRSELTELREALERSVRRTPAPASPIEAAIKTAVREVVREETAVALAAHRASEQSEASARLLSLPEAAARLGISKKALRSRIERGNVPGAIKIGERWHVPLQTTAGAEVR